MSRRRLGGPAALAAFSAAFLALACSYASARPLWTDEIITVHVARLPGPAAIWDVLSRGPEHSAPLYPLLAQAAGRVVPDRPLAARLPAILGTWLMALATYRVASRRLPPAASWVALLLPFSTLALDYVAEGRPYGLKLGLAALALACWQEVGAPGPSRRRGLARLGLWASLAGAVFTHYFAVLCFIPIGLGELARGWDRRRVDWATWTAIVAGLLPLAFCLPFIRYASTFSGGFWARDAQFFHAPLYYETLLGYDSLPGRGILPPLVAALLVAAFASRRVAGRPDAPPATPGPDSAGLETEELVAAAGFAALPVFGIALVRLATDDAVFTARYALPAVIGLALLTADLAARLGRGAGMPRILAACLALWLAYLVAHAFHHVADPRSFAGDPSALADAGDPGEPIVVQAMHPYHELAFDGPEALRARLVHVVGVVGSSDEEITRRLAPLAAPTRPLRVEEYNDLVAASRRFLVLDDGAGPLLDRLIADGAAVELLSAGDLTLYRVTTPGPGPGPS